MTAAEVFQLQGMTEMSYESLTHLLSNLKPEEFDKVFDVARNVTGFEVGFERIRRCCNEQSPRNHGRALKKKKKFIKKI